MSNTNFITIALTPPDFVSVAKDSDAIVRLLQDEKVDYVHLRHPGLPREDMKAILMAIPKNLRKRIAIHSCYDLGNEGLCGGLHLRSTIFELPDRSTDWSCRLSRSCHTPEEIRDADRLGIYDYLTLSPIFDSLSKPGYTSAFLEDDLRRLLSSTSTPVIALGGVTPDKIPYLKDLGFAGCAMLGHFLHYFK